MTNEDALRIATGLRLDFKCESDTMVDFCNTIIKALKQEPYEDCISRQAVLDMAWDVLYEGKYIQVVDVGDIKELPSVTSQLSAHWILYRDHKNMIDYPQCDNCRAIIKLPLLIDNLNFCPNCGREMKGEESEDKE